MTLQQAWLQAAQSFTQSDSPELDAQLLLCEVLQVPRSRCYSHPEQVLNELQLAAYAALCSRRITGEPIAYLLGKQGFWDLQLEVAPGVLIPRPETERLVELALELGPSGAARVADLGTGSGAIALALATQRPQWQLWASELHEEALQIASRNLQRSGCTNLTLVQGSWCDPLPPGEFDLMVANPPYIAQGDPHLEQGDLRFEPRSALVAQDQGLADIISIASQALPRLRAGGYLLLEHGWEQGRAVQEILARSGYGELQTYQDAGNRERVTCGRKEQG